jgi:hypothetical protein
MLPAVLKSCIGYIAFIKVCRFCLDLSSGSDYVFVYVDRNGLALFEYKIFKS